MKLSLLFATTSIGFASADHSALGENGKSGYQWEVLSDVKLPKPLSDFSVSASNGIAYIMGGCDDPLGNSYLDLGENSTFVCNSISSNVYSFDVEDESFTSMPELPTPRYRHSSAIANNKLFVIGGRDIESDSIIAEVDVYDFDAKSWTSYSALEEKYQVSDHTSFAKGDKVYVVGGYSSDYTAQTMMYVIDAAASTSDTWSIEEGASLGVARGDIHSTVSTDGTRAFVAGGFTHEDGFCGPLGSAEEYNFDTNEFSTLPDLRNARGEVVLVELDNHLYAMGGERQIVGVCDDGIRESTEPGELTVGTDEVEALESGGDDWKIVSGFPNHKFRFSAVSYENLEQVYAFGGQTAYASDCDCFRTTDEVAVWGEADSAYTTKMVTKVSALAALSLGVLTGWLII